LRLTSRDEIRWESDLIWEGVWAWAKGALVSESSGSASRRPKRFLSAEQKYEIWLKLLSGEFTTQQAALEVGVDRSTIMTLRKVARDGAIAALQASKPGRRQDAAEITESARLRAENARLSATIVELSIELVALRGKTSWG
jgi:transposase